MGAPQDIAIAVETSNRRQDLQPPIYVSDDDRRRKIFVEGDKGVGGMSTPQFQKAGVASLWGRGRISNEAWRKDLGGAQKNQVLYIETVPCEWEEGISVQGKRKRLVGQNPEKSRMGLGSTMR